MIRQQITKENRQSQVQRLTPMYEALQRARASKMDNGTTPEVESAQEAVRNPVSQT
jgi:acetylglutamate kinase